jgi:hypothetical protein
MDNHILHITDENGHRPAIVVAALKGITKSPTAKSANAKLRINKFETVRNFFSVCIA